MGLHQGPPPPPPVTVELSAFQRTLIGQLKSATAVVGGNTAVFLTEAKVPDVRRALLELARSALTLEATLPLEKRP